MAKRDEILTEALGKEYEHGFTTDVEQEFVPKGLSEDIIRLISAKKGEPQWLLDFRLGAYRKWLGMKAPTWGHLHLPEIDYQDIIYYAAPKKQADMPTEIDPELEKTFDKLGIPLNERKALAGVRDDDVRDGEASGDGAASQVAVDAIFDSVGVKTTFQAALALSPA